ncbi:hypothetical protein [Neorhizobium galegae]|uniref:Uncharacterized protein n=1 Tax=Neorhizobium galegae bv. officinalis bv. officinalis str. HAMBI 1141 TaxID=1028801 RepID=A0A068T338_NEOGA|nr:hypothetical protein [Neorhizobium galegae]UIK04885.1 hypothetical protein LZK81_19860 [Neorhizobium galegae]CDN52514.1 Hypothetical protein RG1141_CH01490 [Neorhizobium galegae bv. officinalis bv. officinalis str. HAMBI 1141]
MGNVSDKARAFVNLVASNLPEGDDEALGAAATACAYACIKRGHDDVDAHVALQAALDGLRHRMNDDGGVLQ